MVNLILESLFDSFYEHPLIFKVQLSFFLNANLFALSCFE